MTRVFERRRRQKRLETTDLNLYIKISDPCMNVLCGYGASCRVAADGNATCLCPVISCSSGGEEELFAPLCGSDGITYPNECRLKAAQCMGQQRIRIVEEKPCGELRRFGHLVIKTKNNPIRPKTPLALKSQPNGACAMRFATHDRAAANFTAMTSSACLAQHTN